MEATHITFNPRSGKLGTINKDDHDDDNDDDKDDSHITSNPRSGKLGTINKDDDDDNDNDDFAKLIIPKILFYVA